MSEEQQSLIEADHQAAAAAPFLFSDFENQAYEALEDHHEFTGERLHAQRPQVYSLVVRMIAEGLSSRSIARACRVSTNTVEAVRRREKIPVEAQKEEILQIVRAGARLCAERVLELAPEMDARDASVAFGILSEKMLLLTGEATVIVGKDEGVNMDDFNRLLDALPRADARVVEEMGIQGQPEKQTAAATSTASPTAAEISDPADDQSDAFLCKGGPRNALRNISGPAPAQTLPPPGGGGPARATPPTPSME
jgi:hypothetical protein